MQIVKEQTMSDLKAAFAGGEEKIKAIEKQQQEENQSSEPQLGHSDCLGPHTDNPTQPRSTGWQMNIDGGQYTVSSCEQRLKGQFELWVRGNALAAISEIGATLGPEAAEIAYSKYITDRGQGHYNFDGKFCREALVEMPGAIHLLFVLLRRCHPKITEDEVRKLFMADQRKTNQFNLENSKIDMANGATKVCKKPTQCGLALRWALGNYFGSALEDVVEKPSQPTPTLG